MPKFCQTLLEGKRLPKAQCAPRGAGGGVHASGATIARSRKNADHVPELRSGHSGGHCERAANYFRYQQHLRRPGAP